MRRGRSFPLCGRAHDRDVAIALINDTGFDGYDASSKTPGDNSLVRRSTAPVPATVKSAPRWRPLSGRACVFTPLTGITFHQEKRMPNVRSSLRADVLFSGDVCFVPEADV